MWLGVVAVLLVAPCAFAQEEVVTETPAAVPAEVVTETPAAVPAESPEDNVEVTDQAVAEQLPAAKKPSDKKHVIIMMYSMSLPLGDSWDYVGQYGWRGTSFEYRYRILPQFSVGATFGWNMSDDKEKGTWTQENVTITGTQVRRLDTLTLAATAHAWLTKSDVILPYLGLELGGYWVSRFTNMGWWSLEEEGWHFGIGPELGFLVPANRKVQFAFSVKYKYLVKTSDLPEEMFLTFNFGMGFLI
jgi:opacity protein-like surface antigen